MTTIFVAIPAYDGKVSSETLQSLLAEQAVLANNGIGLDMGVTVGCSIVAHARNDLAAKFHVSGADYLMWLDGDVAFEPGAILRLLSHDQPIVGGAYRYKNDEEGYPVGFLPQGPVRRKDGLIPVAFLPGGFVMMRRDAFNTIAERDPGRVYFVGENPLYAFFDIPFRDGRLVGEDVRFCEDARAAGLDVLLDPDITLAHCGGLVAYSGRFADWLSRPADNPSLSTAA